MNYLFSLHCNGSEPWQNIGFPCFIFFVCSTLCYQRGDWILTKLVNLQRRCNLSFCLFCTKGRQTYQNIRNVHKTSWFLYRTFTVNLVMYRMFRNAVRCLGEKQRLLILPFLFIINEVDKRVVLWYKLSITEGLGNAFFGSESVIELLDCTFPWIWKTIKMDPFFCYLQYKANKKML